MSCYQQKLLLCILSFYCRNQPSRLNQVYNEYVIVVYNIQSKMLKIDLYSGNWNSVLAHHGQFPISRLSPFEYLIQLPQR